MYNRKGLFIIILFFIGVLSLIVMPFVGMKYIPFHAIFSSSSAVKESEILWKFRIPRVLLSFFAGVGLGLSGMAFQAMFRNPLATPFTLGVSSGAALGAAIYVKTGICFSIIGISGLSLSAFLGAVLSILLVYALSRMKKHGSTATMLLAGVAISFFFSSLIMFIQYICDFNNSFRIMRWLMGGLDIMGFEPLLNMLPFVIFGGIIITLLTNELNLLTIGEEIALSRGVALTHIKCLIFFATSLMVGGIVAICGPIGFVGMMCPHICRLLVGPNHRYLIPSTIVFSGVFLALCDTFARTIIAPAEIPVGVVTALIGGPFFITLLFSKGWTEAGFL
ncbi:iron ABC transporter permease [bacterium]|nr:iron ABC transporter permease [bacterium]